MNRRWVYLRWVPLIALLAFLGCGPQTGSVSGKVTYKGKPVTMGAVAFHRDDGQVESVRIDENGNYVANRAPVGVVKITVTATPPRDAPTPGGKDAKAKGPPTKTGEEKGSSGSAPKGKFVRIPDKYKDKDKSGLEFTVKPGKQEFDIDLKD